MKYLRSVLLQCENTGEEQLHLGHLVKVISSKMEHKNTKYWSTLLTRPFGTPLYSPLA